MCLLLIDGLGLELLRAHQAAAPFLAELAFNSRPLTAGCPSTTVTSLGSLGTGLPPAAHGMLGYQVAVPGEGRLLNGLRWPEDIDPVAWQPQPTIFERAAAAGVTAGARGAGRLQEQRPDQGDAARRRLPGGGLARRARRAGRRRARRVRARARARLPRRPRRDRAQYGVSSPAWVNQLAHVDKLAEQIAAGLPYGSVMYVTADHGMVDVGPDDRIDADAEGSPLRDGVALLGGEARVRHVYTRPGAADDVLATWREVLGERAWVHVPRGGHQGRAGSARSAPRSATPWRARIGDVVAACAGSLGGGRPRGPSRSRPR